MTRLYNLLQGGNHAIYNVWEKMILLDILVGFGTIWFGLVLVGADHCIMAHSFRYISSPNGRCQFEPLLPTDGSLHFFGGSSMLQVIAGVHGPKENNIDVCSSRCEILYFCRNRKYKKLACFEKLWRNFLCDLSKIILRF
jgi:hypothetical protein